MKNFLYKYEYYIVLLLWIVFIIYAFIWIEKDSRIQPHTPNTIQFKEPAEQQKIDIPDGLNQPGKV